MERRSFIKNCAVVSTMFMPWKSFANFLQQENPADCAVNVAHIEDVPNHRLSLLYTRHAEVARDIHAYAAKEMAGFEIPVNLIQASGAIPSVEELKQFKKLDVFSVSSGLSALGSQLSSKFEDNISNYRNFWHNSDAIGVFSAGNDGNTKTAIPDDTIESFGDTSISVGEAGQAEDKSWYVKPHSQKTGNISLVAPNPTDHGLRVHYYEQSPEITRVHADLIKKWQQDNDLSKKILEEYPNFLDLSAGDQGYIYRTLLQQLENDETYQKSLEESAQHFIDNPKELHDAVLKPVRDAGAIDKNGRSGNLEGTSYTAPYVAGAISAAKCLGKTREQQNLSALTPEEIVAIAYLATAPVTKMQDGTEIKQAVNSRGISSSYRAGFGVFNIEKYKKLISEAYKELDISPELKSTQRQIISNPRFSDKGNNIFEIDFPEEGKDITIMKARLEYKSDFIYAPAVRVKITSPSGTSFTINNSQGEDVTDPSKLGWHSWGSTDRFFGEQVEGEWKVELLDKNEEIKIKDLSLTFYGVNKGCLVDKMIDKELGVETKDTNHLKNFLKNRSNNHNNHR